MRIGAHVDQADPLAEAAAPRGRTSSSSSSRTRKVGRRPRLAMDAAALRAADVDIYIHAPYIINVATLNNRIRMPSRKLMFVHAGRGRGRRGEKG